MREDHDRDMEELRRIHEASRIAQENRFRELAENYNAMVTHFSTLVKATGNELATSRLACDRLRDRVEELVYHMTEGQEGEGGPMAEALHQARDDAAVALQQGYERGEALLDHELVRPPPEEEIPEEQENEQEEAPAGDAVDHELAPDPEAAEILIQEEEHKEQDEIEVRQNTSAGGQ